MLPDEIVRFLDELELSSRTLETAFTALEREGDEDNKNAVRFLEATRWVIAQQRTMQEKLRALRRLCDVVEHAPVTISLRDLFA